MIRFRYEAPPLPNCEMGVGGGLRRDAPGGLFAEAESLSRLDIGGASAIRQPASETVLHPAERTAVREHIRQAGKSRSQADSHRACRRGLGMPLVELAVAAPPRCFLKTRSRRITSWSRIRCIWSLPKCRRRSSLELKTSAQMGWVIFGGRFGWLRPIGRWPHPDGRVPSPGPDAGCAEFLADSRGMGDSKSGEKSVDQWGRTSENPASMGVGQRDVLCSEYSQNDQTPTQSDTELAGNSIFSEFAERDPGELRLA